MNKFRASLSELAAMGNGQWAMADKRGTAARALKRGKTAKRRKPEKKMRRVEARLQETEERRVGSGGGGGAGKRCWVAQQMAIFAFAQFSRKSAAS